MKEAPTKPLTILQAVGGFGRAWFSSFTSPPSPRDSAFEPTPKKKRTSSVLGDNNRVEVVRKYSPEAPKQEEEEFEKEEEKKGTVKPNKICEIFRTGLTGGIDVLIKKANTDKVCLDKILAVRRIGDKIGVSIVNKLAGLRVGRKEGFSWRYLGEDGKVSSEPQIFTLFESSNNIDKELEGVTKKNEKSLEKGLLLYTVFVCDKLLMLFLWPILLLHC